MSKKAATPEGEVPKGGKSKKKKMGLVGAVVLVAAGAWFFLLRSPSAAEVPPTEPQPGEVVALKPITINLAGGHFLRLGLGLQVVEGESLAHAAGGDHGGAPVEVVPETAGAKALDAAIEVFSGRTTTQLTGAGRTKARTALLHELEERYHGAVMDVYFTEFVMQ